MKIKESLTYDDVLLVPKYSEIESRSHVDLSVKISKFKYSHPIIPANMKTICGEKMAKFIADTKGLALLHRFMPIEDQLEILNKFILSSNEFNYTEYVGFSVGVKKENYNDIDALVNIGAEILCIDIAHGDSKMCLDTISYIKNKYPNILIIAGNVSTGDAAKRLWLTGANVVKCGIGPGSLCTTRIETGNGVPQLSAIVDIYNIKKEIEKNYKNIYFIADGGINKAGDIVKALCFADMVMVGNLFAGTDETPGKIINGGDSFYKEYVGSSTHKSINIEGVKAIVPYKGPAKNILDKLLQGLKSGCSYQGVNNLVDLKLNPEFVKITNSGLKESNHHDVILKDK